MITKSIEDKKKIHYKETTINDGVMDVDVSKRTVAGLFNSYFYIDSDYDMLLPGAAKKSIQERGVGSESVNKIKHLKDHDWSLNMARITTLEERSVDFNGKTIQGIYHESYYPNTQLATDMLINIQEKVYDNRSIGFNYVQLAFASKDSADIDVKNRYYEYIGKALNPEVAEESGFFWVVPEIRLWEGSDVTFGANSMTPFLGMKSTDKTNLLTKLFSQIDDISRQLKSGKQSDDAMQIFEMQLLQLKQNIKDITNIEPQKSIKDTLKEPLTDLKSTQKQTIDYDFLINNINNI